MSLHIRQSTLDQVLWHLKRVYPHEGCGLFLGRREGDRAIVEEAWPAVNLNTERAADRYIMNPPDQARAESYARGRGWEVIGCYHSHPDHPARPSQFDTDRALEVVDFVGPWVYAVIAVRGGTETEPRAFVLDVPGKMFREIPFVSVEQEPVPAGEA